MRQFPGLNIFCLIGHQISKIEHLEPLVNLEELWICECSIKVSFAFRANTSYCAVATPTFC